jgi:hypothetical protein
VWIFLPPNQKQSRGQSPVLLTKDCHIVVKVHTYFVRYHMCVTSTYIRSHTIRALCKIRDLNTKSHKSSLSEGPGSGGPQYIKHLIGQMPFVCLNFKSESWSVGGWTKGLFKPDRKKNCFGGKKELWRQTISTFQLSGWPDWVNFLLFGDCLLWAVFFFKLQK